MHNLNQILFYKVNTVAGQYAALDRSMLVVTEYFPYLMVAVVLVYMIWIYPKRHPGTLGGFNRFVQSAEFVGALVLTWLVVSCVKVIVAQPRPFLTLAQTVALIPDQGGYSFPSMHAALTTTVAATVYLHHRRLGIYLYVFAFVVAISRVYVGVHYPLDVVVGMILGWGIAVGVHKIFDRNMAP